MRVWQTCLWTWIFSFNPVWTSSTLKIGFALSKRPYLHRADVVTVSRFLSITLTISFNYFFLKIVFPAANTIISSFKNICTGSLKCLFEREENIKKRKDDQVNVLENYSVKGRDANVNRGTLTSNYISTYYFKLNLAG